jgi:SAM-dependent methyltransferase
MNLKETYNRIAQDWFNDHKSDDWWVEGTDKFASLLSSSARVLDVGCGAGVKSRYLSEKGLRVTGIDFSDKLIEIAKREFQNVSFHVMDMRDVKDLNEQFDGVFAQASLLHIPKSEIQELIGKLASVLNAGGYLYVAVKGVNDSGREEGVVRENDYGYEYERFFSYYRMSELEGYLRELNLEIAYQSTKTVGKTDWLQIIGKKS